MMLNNFFSPIIMAVLTCNLLLIITTLCFKSSKIIYGLGLNVLNFFIILIILRFLLPFGFPNAINIPFAEWLSKIIVFIRHPYVFDLSIWHGFLLIWLVGIVLKCWRYINNYRKAKTFIIKYGTNVTVQSSYSDILSRICSQYHKKDTFQIIEISNISTPQILGFFHPIILIPKALTLDSNELYIILSHECMHHFSHHFFLKFAIKILTIIYWWNPYSSILNENFDNLLEMKIDRKLIMKGKISLKAYLKCLIHIADYSLEINNSSKYSLHFMKSKRKILVQRIERLTKEKKEIINPIAIILSGVMICVSILSYKYSFEAYYIPPHIDSISKGLDDDGSYIIKKIDGTYDVYVFDTYIETVFTLDNIPSNTIIYNELEMIKNGN